LAYFLFLYSLLYLLKELFCGINSYIGRDKEFLQFCPYYLIYSWTVKQACYPAEPGITAGF